MTDTPAPPPLAEVLLRAFLTSRAFESVSGDLLEEYRETILGARGKRRADLWYVSQVLGYAWRNAGVWAILFASAFLVRTAVDWRMPTMDFRSRSLVSTTLGVGIFVLAGFWAGSRTGSFGAGGFVGVVTAALAMPLQLLGAVLLFALWHDPITLAAIRGSGGLQEVLSFPLVTVVPGVLFGAIGGVLGAVTKQLRSG